MEMKDPIALQRNVISDRQDLLEAWTFVDFYLCFAVQKNEDGTRGNSMSHILIILVVCKGEIEVNKVNISFRINVMSSTSRILSGGD